MLPIRQHLLTLTCLKGNAKMVLIEVCELAENGKQGGCFVSNATLAKDLGISLKTATRMVAYLEASGLLTASINKAQGNRRYLVPTPAVRACYVGGTVAQQLAAAAELTIVKNDAEPDLTIVNSDPDYSQNGPLTIVKNDPDYSQNASRVYGDDQYDQVTTKDDHPQTPDEWVSERAAFQKKIAHLETENRQLKADLLRLVPPVAEPPREIATESQGPRYSEASKTLAAELASIWSITPMPRHGGKWGLLHRFTHHQEQAGNLAKVRKQFAGFALYNQKRGIEAMNLDKFLGSEAGGFEGEWCQTDWPAKAQQARANGDTPAMIVPVTRVAAGKKFVND